MNHNLDYKSVFCLKDTHCLYKFHYLAAFEIFFSTSPHPVPVRALSVDTDPGYDNPFISNGSEATSTSCSINSSPRLVSPRLQYKEIQKGGDIPLSGLRKPAPVTPPPRAGRL